nr:ion transporter [Alphaproteobacteria bacterium]
PWSFFDFLVVSIALVPSQDAFSALRAARALRVLRMISIFPKLGALLKA